MCVSRYMLNSTATVHLTLHLSLSLSLSLSLEMIGIPFTAGPRVCLGQRFSALESVCIIARILRKYRLSPTPEVAKLTRREQWVKLTKWSPGVTATPGKVKLVLQIRD